MFQPSTRVTIHTPMPGGTRHGVYATGGDKQGCNVKVRVGLLERDRIIEAAELLGMTKAAFIRWCAVEVANEIKEQHEAYRMESGN